VKEWRATGKAVTIDVRTLRGQTVDSTTLKLKLVDGKVVTERFIISPLGTDADESLAEEGNRVLVVPDLRHNLIMKIDSRDLTVIQLAGVQIDGIDGERFVVGDFQQVNPEASASSQAYETKRSYTISARNIDGSVTVKVAGGFNGTARTIRDKAIELEEMEIGHGLQKADVPDLPLAMGSNHISMTAKDRDQRQVAQPHPDEVFIQHPGIPAHVNEDELSLDKQVLYIEVDGSHVDGSVPAGSNQTRMPLLNPLCRRLKLRVVGVEEYKQRGHHLVRVWLKHDGNRDRRDVLNELKTAGFIARSYRDDNNLVPALRDVPVTEQKLSWQTRTKPRSDWHNRVFNATQAMYDNQAATLNAMLQTTPDRSVYVVDARSEPRFSALAITSSFAVRKPFLELNTRSPAYAASDGTGPTYILKSFTITGADQARSESRSFPQGVGNGQPLRVKVDNGPAVISVSELIGPQTKGVIISIHGFNVDSSTQTGTKFMDGTLRNYWPMMQGMMRDPTLGNLPWNPQTKEGYLILHVAWTGDYRPPAGFNRGLYFNWDMALAHDAGDRVLWQMIRDINIRRDALNIPMNDFPLTLLAESLGNRTAISLLNQFSERLGDNGKEPSALTPLVRYTMAHPALRHVDLANESPALKLPQSPIQTEIRALRANNQTALLFYSPFDKPGLIFNTAQNPPVGRELPEAFMLGRVGLQGTGYDYAVAPLKVRAFHANRGTAHEDVWHVTLFGWVLPGMQSVSRPTYEWNQTRNAVTRGLISLHESGGNIQITQPQHLTPIWRAMGRYAASGVIPEGLDLESPEVSTLLQGGAP